VEVEVKPSTSGAAKRAKRKAPPAPTKGKKAAVSGTKKGKKVLKKKQSMKTVVKNYASEEKNDENIILFDGTLGSGYTCKLSKWMKNEQCYIQIRRSSTAGVNIPAGLHSTLYKALKDMQKKFPSIVEAPPKH